MAEFKHVALEEEQAPMDKIIFTAMSKKLFYMRFFISKHVFDNNAVPLNPFTTFDYFMLDTVDRNIIRKGNNTLVKKADELWTYGDISNGMLAEIIQAKRHGRPIRHFIVDKDKYFTSVEQNQLIFEDEIADQREKFLRGKL